MVFWVACLPTSGFPSFPGPGVHISDEEVEECASKAEVGSRLIHVQMGRSETIQEFMKWFKAALLQLDAVSPDIVLQSVKQANRPIT